MSKLAVKFSSRLLTFPFKVYENYNKIAYDHVILSQLNILLFHQLLAYTQFAFTTYPLRWLADWLPYYSWIWMTVLSCSPWPRFERQTPLIQFNSIIKITSFSKIPLYKHVYLSEEGHHLMDRLLLLFIVFTAVKPIRKLTFYVENHHLLFIYLFTSSHSRWLTCKVFFSSYKLPLTETDIWNLVDLLSWFAFGLVLFQARGWYLLS